MDQLVIFTQPDDITSDSDRCHRKSHRKVSKSRSRREYSNEDEQLRFRSQSPEKIKVKIRASISTAQMKILVTKEDIGHEEDISGIITTDECYD
ncbi:hypothetical protein Tco_0997225, partial [Tanacetum coccineum]